MPIGKWIPFAQPTSNLADTPIPKPVLIPCTADGKQFGLENFGNTCYANSVLQALYFCAPFRDLVIQHANSYISLHNAFSPTNTPNSPGPAPRRVDRKSTQDGPAPPSPPRTLFSALRALYIHISQNPADKGTIAPRPFIEKLRELNEGFRNTMHHDAHEFLNYLLNRIVEEVEEERRLRLASGDDLTSSSTASHPPAMIASTSSSSTQPPGATFIHQIFEGILTSETRCLTCENVSSRDESFLDLSIDIEQNSSVTACLRQFSASEMLCQKEKFFCDACCDLQEAERRMKIKRLPNVLALHLKRFKFQEDGQRHIKLTYRVAFPFELRLFNTVDDISNPDRLYELFAIVVHIGNGPNHGHYVSIIKTMGTWLVFDDETVDSIKESDIPKYFGDSNSGSAYVLYYQALDIDYSTLGLTPPSPQPATATAPVHPGPPQVSQPTDSPVSTEVSLPPGLNDPPVPGVLSRPVTPPPAQIQPPLEPIGKSPSRQTSTWFINGALSRPSTMTHEPVRNDRTLRNSRSVFLDEKSTSLKLDSPPIAILAKDGTKPPLATAVNGKERDSEKSMISWLRLQFRNPKSRPSLEVNVDAPPLVQDVLSAPGSPARNQSISSSSNSSKDSRRVLESPSSGHRHHRVSPLPNGKSPTHSRVTDTSSYDTESRHSSTSASSNTTPTSPPPDRRLHPRVLPSIPASPQAPRPETQVPPSEGTNLNSHGRMTRRRTRPSIRDIHAPQSTNLVRPATSAGAITPTTTSLPSPPSPNRPSPVPYSSVASSKSDPGEGVAVGRSRTVHSPYGFQMLPPNAATPPSPTHTPSTPLRRTTRKLSLSTPILGFKKRDKDQQ